MIGECILLFVVWAIVTAIIVAVVLRLVGRA